MDRKPFTTVAAAILSLGRGWRGFALAGLMVLAAPLQGQNIGVFAWMVTHDKQLAAYLTGMEASRATLEANIAAQRAFQMTVGNFQVGTESYHALRAYAKALRLIRMARQIKRSYANLDFRGREWALLPQIRMTAPVEIGKDDEGNPIIGEKEMFSLSLVPPELQASWDVTKYPDDDFLAPQGAHSSSFIKLDYPHKLSDVQFTWTPSPFLDIATDETNGMFQLMAHSYEALLTAAARLSGYGVRVNPQVLASGAVLLEGRATPAQMKLQGQVYEQQALGIIDNIVRLYVDNGMSINNAEKRMAYDKEFFEGFGDRVLSSQSARIAFSMNLLTEINQTIARLETYERVRKDAETDDLLKNMGKQKNADGTYKSMTEGGDIWDDLDRLLSFNPHGDAIKLQAKGLSARYAHSQFEEAQGWRNIMAGLMRAEVAMDGVAQVQESAREADRLVSSSGLEGYDTPEQFQGLVKQLRHTQSSLASLGWGGGP